MGNRKIQINNTGQFYSMCVKLSNMVCSIATNIEKRILLCLEYLSVKYIPYTIIRHWYKSHTRIVGGINCMLNKKQTQPDPPLG